LRDASRLLSKHEVRFLTDAYLTQQKLRIIAGNMSGALEKSGEPHEISDYLKRTQSLIEVQIRQVLDIYSKTIPAGRWMREIKGIGPVICSGMLAHFDVEKAPNAAHYLSFMGYNPNKKWEKGTKRPWNGRLKVLGFFAGQSFEKQQNRKGAWYGHLYAMRKAQEVYANEQLKFKDQAAASLANKKYRPETEAYKAYIEGKLPPEHIRRRAYRYAVKLMVCHLHEIMYWCQYEKLAPEPYAVAFMKHAHIIAPPHLNKAPDGFAATLAKRCPTVTIEDWIENHKREDLLMLDNSFKGKFPFQA
jgi:hypothetical protein